MVHLRSLHLKKFVHFVLALPSAATRVLIPTCRQGEEGRDGQLRPFDAHELLVDGRYTKSRDKRKGGQRDGYIGPV